MPYWRLHYHLVWATTNRNPDIDAQAAKLIQQSITSTARSLKVILHATGIVEDHVHVVASIPPNVAISNAVGRFKGAASHAVNSNTKREAQFHWQEEYGALSVSDRGLAFVVEYAQSQQIRHAELNLITALERIEPEQSKFAK